LKGSKKLATGTPKAQWNGEKLHASRSNGSVSLPFMQLGYEGKRPEHEILQTAPGLIKTLWQGGAEKDETLASNRLYYGDNLPILASLLREPSICGKVQLIYIDPPFATNSVFQSRAQGDAYHDLLIGARYIEFLRERLVLLRELLAEDGSIYVHLDENMAFHIKVIMDEVFGAKNFRNWITRKKCNPKNYTRKTFGNVADFILFYTKSENYVWNRPVEGWTEEHALKEYDYVEKETGRRYKKVPVHAPGTRNGETGMPWREKLPPPGKHWQFPPRVLDEMDARGEIYWSPNGNPRRKIYLDASSGIPVQDIWLDFRDAHNQNIEITGYPTEKNPALPARIVEASSNPGDLVLDCFAGSGTTLAAASQLKRRWIGIDNSVEAISTILRRFAKGLEPMGDFVDKQESQQRSLQKPLLWESAEKPDETEERNKIPSKNGHHTINNFSLKTIESFTGDLDTALQQWLAWQ
jgi:adenine-specific DNA-methyltransferase